jgi:ferredoxin
MPIMQISIDYNSCAGHGRCYTTSPKLFDADDEGRGVTIMTEVPPELENSAREAVGNCPERAVKLHD